MKRSLILLAFLLLLSWGIQAYNVHTALTNPKVVSKLLSEENAQFIAVYVKDNFLGPTWKVASYNQANSTLKITTIRAVTFPYPRIEITSKTATTPYNYSKISTDYQQITAWPKETPALFFAGRWYTPEDFSTRKPEFNESKGYQSIYAFYSKNDLWIGEVEIKASPDASFGKFSPGRAIVPLLSTEGKATNLFYISSANLGDFLVLPDLSGSYTPTVWRLEERRGNASMLTLIYPGYIRIGGAEINRTPYQCEFRLDENLTVQMMRVIAYIRKFNAVHAGVGFFRPCNNSELKWVLTIDSNEEGVVTGGNITPYEVVWG